MKSFLTSRIRGGKRRGRRNVIKEILCGTSKRERNLNISEQHPHKKGRKLFPWLIFSRSLQHRENIRHKARSLRTEPSVRLRVCWPSFAASSRATPDSNWPLIRNEAATAWDGRRSTPTFVAAEKWFFTSERNCWAITKVLSVSAFKTTEKVFAFFSPPPPNCKSSY